MNIFKFIRRSFTKDTTEKKKETQKDSKTKPRKKELYQDNEDIGFC